MVFSTDSPQFDFGGLFDPAFPTRLTAPVGGIYQVSGAAVWEENATGFRILTLRVDGAIAIAEDSRSAASSVVTEQALSTSYLLEAGQYVELVATQVQDPPADLDILALGQASPALSLVLLSPTS